MPAAGETQTSCGRRADPLDWTEEDAEHVILLHPKCTHPGVTESPTCSSHRSLTEVEQEEN